MTLQIAITSRTNTTNPP